MRVKWYDHAAQNIFRGRVIQFVAMPVSSGDDRTMAIVLMDDPEGNLKGDRLRTVITRYLRVDPPDRL